MATFVAIDFETADWGADSACAVGLVRVEGGRVVAQASCLIRPPRRRVVFTHIHGLAWADLRDQPVFAEVWPGLAPLIEGADCFAAHNAAFDRAVLRACCAAAGLVAPSLRFLCTVRLARAAWGIRPTRLPDVCARLGIGLRHHDAASDAHACAEIALAAARAGFAVPWPPAALESRPPLRYNPPSDRGAAP